MATILIVDDRPVDRQFMVTLLGYAGHRPLEAADGEQALQIAHAERPGLIITDVLMPTMDGFTFVRQLREDPALKRTPVIFYSASYLESQARKLADACGVKYVLLKPSEPQVILDTVSRALGSEPPSMAEMERADFQQQTFQLVAGELWERLDVVAPRLAALVQLGQEMSRGRDVGTLLQQFCHSARDIIGSKYAAIGILGDGDGTLTQFIVSGMSQDSISQVGQPPTGKGLLGKLSREGKPIRLADLTVDSSAAGFPPNHPPMRSLLGVPIRSATGYYGWLYFTEKIGAAEFSDEDQEMATALASQCALAYENSVLFSNLEREVAARTTELQAEIEGHKRAKEEISRRNRALSVLYAISRATAQSLNLSETLDDALAVTLDVLRIEAGGISLMEPGGQFMEIRAHRGISEGFVESLRHIPLGEGLTGKVASEKRPVALHIAELPPGRLAPIIVREGFESLAGIPLLSSDRLLGTLIVGTRRAYAFPPEELELLMAIGQQLGTAVRNAELNEALHQELAERTRAEQHITLLNEELEARVEARTRELQDSQRQLSLIYDSISDVIFLLAVGSDERFRFVSVNHAFVTATGLSEDKVAGKLVQEVIPEPAHALVLGKYREAILDKRTVTWEEVSEYPTGTKYGVVSVTPVFDDEGNCTYLVGAVHDVTERRQAEEEIRKLNDELEQRVNERTSELEATSKELEAFSYSVSHDLRAPLRAIDGFSGMLLEDFGDQLPSEGRRYLGVIRRNVQNMGALVDALLTLSRLSREPLATKQVRMGDLVKQSFDELQAEREGRQAELIIGDLPPAQGESTLLKQVWLNLLGNALKFSRGRDISRIEVGCLLADGRDVYYVKDNGAGFDMRYADKLFGVFQRLHRDEEFEGTGVGLATVQRIIHRHGGHIWAEAELDKGATFHFTLGDAGKID